MREKATIAKRERESALASSLRITFSVFRHTFCCCRLLLVLLSDRIDLLSCCLKIQKKTSDGITNEENRGKKEMCVIFTISSKRTQISDVLLLSLSSFSFSLCFFFAFLMLPRCLFVLKLFYLFGPRPVR